MKFLFHILARLRRLKWHDIGQLSAVCVLAFFTGLSIVWYDVVSVSYLLKQMGTLTLGFDYLLVGILWIPTAYYSIILERRRGYGAACGGFVVTLLFAVFAIFGQRYVPDLFSEVMFASKYGVLFFINVCFWTIVERFIRISISSLKFLGIVGCELLGFSVASGVGLVHPELNLVYGVLASLALTTILLKILGQVAKVPKETFIKKTGGVQDTSERVILDIVLLLNFLLVLARALIDFGTYQYIVTNDENVVVVISMIWSLFSAIGVVIMLLFSQTSLLYGTLWALLGVSASVCACAFGMLLSNKILLYGGNVCFMLGFCFYAERYLSLLACPLALGQGIRLKKLKRLLMVPVAFVLAGAMILTLTPNRIIWILFGLGIVLLLSFGISGRLYGRQLIKMCSLRLWRGGQFVLTYPPLKQMVYQGLSKNNPAEVIYFLTILEESRAAGYRACLLEALLNRSISVRLFALKKLAKVSLKTKDRIAIMKLFQQDPCEEIQSLALSLLIVDELERNESRTWKKYKEYLNDKKYVVGACVGFLSGRGAWLNQVIDKVLQLANSKREKDNLMALQIMFLRPRVDWVDAVSNLLNKEHLPTIKAALSVAGKLASPVLLNRVLTLLDEPRWRDPVLEVLDQYGKVAFPTIEKMIVNEDVPLERRRELILFLGRLPSGEGKQILLRALFGANRSLRPSIIETLIDSGIVWIHAERKKLLTNGILLDVKEWKEMHNVLAQTENLSNPKLKKVKTLLSEALNEEMDRARRMILSQLNLYSAQPLFQKAVAILQEDDLNAYLGAVGDLQDMLPSKLYKEVRDILLFPLKQETLIEEKNIDSVFFLNQFLLNPYAWVNSWMKALALFGWYMLNHNAGLVSVKQELKSHEWIVLETALYALGRLEKNRKTIHELALSVPTSYLMKQNFQELLEGKNADHH